MAESIEDTVAFLEEAVYGTVTIRYATVSYNPDERSFPMRALPEPRPLIAPLRTVETAQTSLRRLPDRRLLMTSRHAPLRGVTPEMLVWWFQNVEGTITVDGREYPRYLIWHPYDHIHYDTTRHGDGSVSPGVRFHIVEAFGRDPSLRVETRDHVEVLDTSGLRQSARLAGIEMFVLHHRFTREQGATQYDSTMVFGMAGALGRLVNPVLNRCLFDEQHGHAWIKHNIEEVGLFEELLPRLCRDIGERDRTSPAPPRRLAA
jgi:hypothetical protein